MSFLVAATAADRTDRAFASVLEHYFELLLYREYQNIEFLGDNPLYRSEVCDRAIRLVPAIAVDQITGLRRPRAMEHGPLDEQLTPLIMALIQGDEVGRMKMVLAQSGTRAALVEASEQLKRFQENSYAPTDQQYRTRIQAALKVLAESSRHIDVRSATAQSVVVYQGFRGAMMTHLMDHADKAINLQDYKPILMAPELQESWQKLVITRGRSRWDADLLRRSGYDINRAERLKMCLRVYLSRSINGTLTIVDDVLAADVSPCSQRSATAVGIIEAHLGADGNALEAALLKDVFDALLID